VNNPDSFIKQIFWWVILTISHITVLWGQTTAQEIFDNPEKSGGVQYAYPVQHVGPAAPYPDGYKPFYISHFGRHGSRYLVTDNEYKEILDLFNLAYEVKALTMLGKDVFQRLKTIWLEAEGHGGELSPLGIEQQKSISSRLITRYPEVFGKKAKIAAVSTTVPRCIHSMEHFCQRLTEFNPEMIILQDADSAHMEYLNFHTPEAVRFRSDSNTWKQKYNQFEKLHVHPERLMNSLFIHTNFLPLTENANSLMLKLFNIASNLQNMQTEISLYDLFEKQELFNLWQCRNYKLYVQYANAAENGGIMMENAKPLLKNIIETANKYIESNSSGASFRFGHDGNIIPLAMLLHLEDCYNSASDPSDFYKVWSDFKVAPMAGNIQIIFFKKNGSKDILVKFLHNETIVKLPLVSSYSFPYYLWSDVLDYYEGLLR